MKMIAIGGYSGSGKTYLTQHLKKDLPGCEVLSLDAFYRDQSHLPEKERDKLNYDHPEMIDDKYLSQVLKDLREGKDTEIPIYDFVTHTRKKETIPFKKTDLLILEGTLLYPILDQLPPFDLKIFIYCDNDLALARRIKRDSKERGRSLDSVLTQYFKTVKPSQEIYISPRILRSDVIFNNNLLEGLDEEKYLQLVSFIRRKLL